ncbi:MAG TPA: lysine--tRNA ligase, partial [Armatimonadetes bacterium]|nr:lysine--tRNA ligase [Armatimonadota bacterium]
RSYLDLMVNPEVREVFVKRSRIIRAIRALLDERGFVEVETPVMQPLPGGAAARPFITHHNALDIDLYLRIAPELYLKRLLVGGFEKVYEIGKNFRNEGISSRHNPEFTMLEAYQAYADFEDMMKLCEDIVLSAAEAAGVEGTLTYQGQRIDLSPPWRRARYFDLLKEHTGLDFESLRDEKDALEAARKLGIPDDYAKTPWSLMDKAFEIFVQPHLIQPTFVTHYPVEVSPLAKRDPKEPRLVQRFEPFIGGQELGNAFSELNDPVDQRGRFEQQAKLRERGEEEAHVMDEDFLMALEYGMPPAGGLGIGIDRLCMVLLDKPSIREVILFPQLRPEGG